MSHWLGVIMFAGILVGMFVIAGALSFAVSYLTVIVGTIIQTRHEYVLGRISPGDKVLHIGASGNEWELDQRWDNGDAPLHKKICDKAGIANVVAIDISEQGVELLKKRGYIAHVADVESWSMSSPVGYGKYDVVVAGEVIEHLTYVGDFLEQIKRDISEGAKIVITTPNMLGVWSYWTYGIRGKRESHEEHVSGFKSDFVENIAQRHGYKVTDISFTASDDLGKRRLWWLKEIPERLCPRLQPILCWTMEVE